MPRTVQDAPLTTKAARDRLVMRHQPYWRAIDAGAAVGYRKGKNSSVWLVRAADPSAGGGYRQATIGRADDSLTADGASVLDFRQAEAAARRWVSSHNRFLAGLTPEMVAPVKPYTLAEAMADYAADYAARGGKDMPGLMATIEAHILPTLGAVRVVHLTAAVIRKWHHGLAAAAPRVRRKAGATVLATRNIDSADPDRLRSRRATANRVLTVLKAGLNLAYRDGRVSSDDAWRRALPFRDAESARIRHLDDKELRNLVNAAPADFRPMVKAALMTGCRYGELCALRVSDFDATIGAVRVRVSKGGKPRSVTLSAEGLAFFQALAVGKEAGAILLARGDGRGWRKSDQHRQMKTASSTAGIAPVVSFHILRHAYAARLVRAGLPIGVVAAQLGHAEAICAKHYAHLAPGFIADAIRGAFTPMGIT